MGGPAGNRSPGDMTWRAPASEPLPWAAGRGRAGGAGGHAAAAVGPAGRRREVRAALLRGYAPPGPAPAPATGTARPPTRGSPLCRVTAAGLTAVVSLARKPATS